MENKILNKRVLVLLLLFLFAFLIRFSFISKGPFHYDGLDLALASEKTLDAQRLHYEHGTGYPLTVICGAFFIYIFRFFGIADPVFCVNFMSVLFGAMGVLLLFFLVERMFDFHKAMFSAIILAVFAPHVAISTFGKSLTLGIVLSLSSAYYMYRYIQESRKADLIYSAFFLGFCAAARLSDVLVVVPILYLFFSAGRINLSRLKEFLIFVSISVSVAIIYYLPMFMEKGFSQWSAVFGTIEQSAFLGFFSVFFLKTLSWTLHVFFLGGTLLSVGGFVFICRDKKIREFIFLLIWFLILYMFYGNVTSSGVRYLVIAWIPLIVSMGFFLGKTKGARFYMALILVFVFALVAFRLHYLALEFRHNHALQVDFAKWLGTKTGPEDVIIAMDEGIFIENYAKRKVVYAPVPRDAEMLENFFTQVIDKFLNQGVHVYCVSSIFSSYDYLGLFKEKIFERYNIELVGSKINEDWHHALLNQVVFMEELFRLKKRTGA